MQRLHREELDLAIAQARVTEVAAPAGLTHRDQIVLDMADEIEYLRAEQTVQKAALERYRIHDLAEEHKARREAELDAYLLATIVQKAIDGGYAMFNLDSTHIAAARRSLARPSTKDSTDD